MIVFCTEIVVKLAEWKQILEGEGEQNLDDNQLVESRGGRKAAKRRPRESI